MAPTPKQRDIDRTRNDILMAAQSVFTNKGYDAAGVREIAELAGCNVALINRYYGSKEGLFRQSILPYLSMSALLDIPIESFSSVAGELFATKVKSENEFDPTLAVIKSAGSKAVSPLISEALSAQVISPLAKKLGGDTQKAALIIATLVGTDIIRRVLKMESLTETDSHVLAERLKAMIDCTSNL